MSSDAISSVAYATDEILLVLAGAGVSLTYGLPVAAVIVVMLGTFPAGHCHPPQGRRLVHRDPRAPGAGADRLVFHNGILLLASASALLMIVFHASTDALIPLFAIGVYKAICLSQTSMTLHWLRERGTRWAVNALANGCGAVLAGIVCVVAAVTKFTQGAWAVPLLIPLLVLAMRRVHRHYSEVERETALPDDPGAARAKLRQAVAPLVVVPIASLTEATGRAFALAGDLSAEVTAVYVATDPAATTRLREDWARLFPDRPLEILPSPYREVNGPLLSYLRERVREAAGRPVVVVLPEIVPHR